MADRPVDDALDVVAAPRAERDQAQHGPGDGVGLVHVAERYITTMYPSTALFRGATRRRVRAWPGSRDSRDALRRRTGASGRPARAGGQPGLDGYRPSVATLRRGCSTPPRALTLGCGLYLAVSEGRRCSGRPGGRREAGRDGVRRRSRGGIPPRCSPGCRGAAHSGDEPRLRGAGSRCNP